MSVCPPLLVPAPTVQPYSHGLFSVAQMPVDVDPHWRCGIQWEPYACAPARLQPVEECEEEPPPWESDDGVPLVEASPFVVYGSYHCRLPGRSLPADIEDRARQALLLGEQRAVEEALWTGSAGNTPHLASPDAVVLNPVPNPGAADALSPVAAIAALESYLGANYGGVGVIHIPRGAAAVLARHHQFCGDCAPPLRTVLGTAVAAGGGYVVNTGPDGSPAPPGTAWAYATGPVAIRRSEIFMLPDSLAGAFNRTTNEVEVIAAREYVIGWDCVLAAVLINVSC